jgi:purine-nucleoside/S-methyl-5'-thioadenosine phosphorylase / adenosine deaminase
MSDGYPLRVPAWAEIPHLVHGFLGRAHGLPPGPFTLDDVRDALVRAGESPVLVAAARQVHGATVVGPEDLSRATATEASDLPPADALVSGSADLVVTIRTADCVPILLVAPRARAVAAVHAGWRGTLAGVIEAALTALDARYSASADEVAAAIGPAIGGCCYAFGAEHWSAFTARFGTAVTGAWREDPLDHQRGHLDLRLVCRLALERAGVPADAITVLGPCTADHPNELHSFRRDGAHAGRQLSYIGWSS